MPYTWVECKKKCGMRTGSFVDGYDQRDLKAERKAVQEWNRMVQNEQK